MYCFPAAAENHRWRRHAIYLKDHMALNLQKIGGIAAAIEAVAYIAGFTVMLAVLTPDNAATLTPVQKLGFLISKMAIFHAWNLFIYVIFGLVLVVLALSLHERLVAGAPAITKTATIFALIWAGMVICAGMIGNIGLSAVSRLYASDPVQASLVWHSIGAVQNGIGGGVELVGGLWVTLISWAALRTGALPKWLNYLGCFVGAAGVLTMFPPLGELGAVFGLGQIAWFAWLAIVLARCGTDDLSCDL